MKKVTFLVDPGKLFDVLHAAGGIVNVPLPLDAVAGVLMTGEPSFRDHLRLAVAGVEVVSVESIP